MTDPIPIIDLHCDMLAYLAKTGDHHPGKTEDIGCALPYLREGNVGLQVMAVWTAVGRGSIRFADKQVDRFQRLTDDHPESFRLTIDPKGIDEALHSESHTTGIVIAIENASGLCLEDEPLSDAYRRIERIEQNAGRIFYVSLTHAGENRFAGGNTVETGLKKDGRNFLDFLNGRGIAADLSHASTRSMIDILNHTEKNDLDIPVIASHSNFRSVYEHSRNLPDDIAREIVRREGLIGITFVRAFVHPDKPEKLIEHILHGFEIGAGKAVSFGADFFGWKIFADASRLPYFFDEHAHAGKYPEILGSLTSRLGDEEISGLAHRNAYNFMKNRWTEK